MKGFLSFALLVLVLFARAQDTTQYTPYELLSSYYDNGFKPFAKKNWFVGAAFSVSSAEQENTSSLFSTVIQGENQAYDITLKGGYFLGDYFMLGAGLTYSQSRFEGLLLSNSDTISRKSLGRNYGITPSIRTYFPLVKSERFSFFNDVNLGFSYGTEVVRDTKNLDEIDKQYNQNFIFKVGLSPGITFFAMQNFAFEVQLDILTYKLDYTQNDRNEDNPSKEVSHDLNLSIDLLSLDLGLAYYFGAKKGSK